MLVVLVFGMTNVDVAIVLGPSTPSTLAVQVARWMTDPDLALRPVAAAGAAILLAATLAVLALWLAGERIVARLGRAWIASGRGLPEAPARTAGIALGTASAAAVLGGIAALALWSVAGRWSFPALAPDALTGRSWTRFGPEMLATAGDTLALAAAATAISLALVIGCLEAEHRHGGGLGTWALWLLYLPLLVPQVAFLPGLQRLPLSLGFAPSWPMVLAAHVVFVLPYAFLSLAGPWRAWDARIARVAAGLGASPNRTLARLRLPMLTGPLLVAAAIGVAVSVGQYLPTLLLGGGRVSTLATEAVALASGGDRRAIGVWGLGQAAAALLPFALALAIPAILWRRRAGMRHV